MADRLGAAARRPGRPRAERRRAGGDLPCLAGAGRARPGARRAGGIRVAQIGLAGGVFQNRLLCEMLIGMAEADGFRVVLPEHLPCNDAAISFGQVVEAGCA